MAINTPRVRLSNRAAKAIPNMIANWLRRYKLVNLFIYAILGPQHFLYFFLLPQAHGWFLMPFLVVDTGVLPFTSAAGMTALLLTNNFLIFFL